MPINIKQDSFFKGGYNVRFISGWDDKFKKGNIYGTLLFYLGNPKYIVDVEIITKEKLEEEDIIITTSDHNAPDIQEVINKNKDTIYELCKSCLIRGFLLDLETIKIVSPADFTGNFPVKGLNTFFMFKYLPNQVFSIFNLTRNINDNEFYTWLISYIYSYHVCLDTRQKVEPFAKKFLQAASGYASTNGKAARVLDNPSVLDCGLSNVGELLLPIPGNRTKRFESLVESAIEQMAKKSNKKKGK